jgi:hypothetical protein
MAALPSLWGRQVLPFYGALLALVGLALLMDVVLHLADAVWIGRYLGMSVVRTFGTGHGVN